MKKLDYIIRKQQAYESMKAQNKSYFQCANNSYLSDINEQIKKRQKKASHRQSLRWIPFSLLLFPSLILWVVEFIQTFL